METWPKPTATKENYRRISLTTNDSAANQLHFGQNLLKIPLNCLNYNHKYLVTTTKRNLK